MGTPRDMLGELSASLMCAELGRLDLEISHLERAGVDSFHFDVMDGHFAPNLALTPDIVAALRPLSQLPFCTHAMVENPEMWVEHLARAGTNVFVFHVEATRYPRRLMKRIQDNGMTPGIAINPGTPVETLQSVADITYVLVMTVEPGYAGQDWITTSPAKVRAVTQLCGAATSIAVDGHVDRITAPLLAEAGANVFVCGTGALFGGRHDVSDYKVSVDVMRGSVARVESQKFQ